MATTRIPAAYRGADQAAPTGVQGGSYTAELDTDETVLFVIGMRINRLRKVRSWWPVFIGMPRMLKELEDHPEAGLLDARSFMSGRVLIVLQHWRSAEDLGRYAKDPALLHHPAWAAYNKAAAGGGDVGIFHETYVVPAAGIESLYGNMPQFGLGLAHASVPRALGRRNRAQDRMGQQDPEYVDRVG